MSKGQTQSLPKKRYCTHQDKGGQENLKLQEWWNGRHEGLKILWPLPAVWVRVPLPVLKMADNPRLPAINFSLTEDGDKIEVAIIEEEEGKMSDRHPQSFLKYYVTLRNILRQIK